MARVTHIKPSNMRKDEAIRKAHEHLLRHYRELGMTHPPCSVPGCKGYTPSEKREGEKKSLLEDPEAFSAWRRSLLGLRFWERFHD
ncbi:MAG: hypothetical protein QW231_06590 [Candidatus Bathyarchaeia archaeon]